MSISTYNELKTAVANWLHRSDLVAIIPDLISLGEKRIFRKVRCRVMESTLSGTMSNGVITVPSDYLELKFAYLTTTPVSKLSKASASQIYDMYPVRSSDARPKYIAREGSSFIFGPYPDGVYSIAGTYYARPEAVETSANALFVANPDLYLFAALCEAAPYIKDDPRLAIWEAKFALILDDIASEAADEEASGGGMQVRPG